MSYRATAIMTSNGQFTLPDVIREHLGVKEGDRLDFDLADSGKLTVVAVKRRSILESRQELEPLTLGRPLTQKDIDDAVAEEMEAQELRISRQYER